MGSAISDYEDIILYSFLFFSSYDYYFVFLWLMVETQGLNGLKGLNTGGLND